MERQSQIGNEKERNAIVESAAEMKSKINEKEEDRTIEGSTAAIEFGLLCSISFLEVFLKLH